MVARQFDTLDVLSVLHQRSTAEDIRSPDAVKRHLLGRSISHACDYEDECAHYLAKMHPQLLNADFSAIEHGVPKGSPALKAWQDAQIAKFGKTLPVTPVKEWLEAHPEDKYVKLPVKTWANLPGRILDGLAYLSLRQ